MDRSPARPSLGAYVPCFNNVATIRRAVEGLLAQTVKPAVILVVDDGSTDRSAEAVADLDVRIVTHRTNCGRGAARSTAMRELPHEFVVCCDATNVLEPRFIEKGLAWFEEPRVAAVSGRITQGQPRTVAERWRGRHLFKVQKTPEVRRGGSLPTWGTLVRASAIRDVGGFRPELSHSEDADLAARVLAAGFDIVHDPDLRVISVASNSALQVLERYWRWYAGVNETISWRGYWKNIGYSLKAMARDDLRARDPLSIPLSLATPHYQFWRTWFRRISARPR